MKKVIIFCLLLSVIIGFISPVLAAQFTLSWGDASNNEDGFKIERKISTTGTFAQIALVAANVTSYPDPGLANDTTYCYRVRAYNSAGDSAYSNEPCGTTPPYSFTLSVTKNGTGQGTVTSSPAGIDCGTDCSETYTAPTSLTLTATPTSGSTFSGWSGACTGTSTCTLSFNVDTTVTTTFPLIPPPPASGLVAAYSFNAGSGTAVADSSGLNNNGTLFSATWTTIGKYGNALSFNGTNAWVTIPDANSLDLSTGMTLEAWVYPTGTLTGWRSLLIKEAPPESAYELYANTDINKVGGYVYINHAYGGAFSTSKLSVNTWTHLATTYNGATLKLYVNGIQVGSKPQTGAMSASSGPLRIAGSSMWGEYFKGRIDEVRVYARSLTAQEIQTDMNTPVTP